MGNAVTVTPGSGFTSATATLQPGSDDMAGIVTFTTASTIPAGPYLIFTLQWGGSWAATYEEVPAIGISACANPNNNRTASQMLAVAALGPFCIIPNSLNTTAAVYCTNAPAESTAYDIAYFAIQGPLPRPARALAQRTVRAAPEMPVRLPVMRAGCAQREVSERPARSQPATRRSDQPGQHDTLPRERLTAERYRCDGGSAGQFAAVS